MYKSIGLLFNHPIIISSFVGDFYYDNLIMQPIDLTTASFLHDNQWEPVCLDQLKWFQYKNNIFSSLLTSYLDSMISTSFASKVDVLHNSISVHRRFF